MPQTQTDSHLNIQMKILMLKSTFAVLLHLVANVNLNKF